MKNRVVEKFIYNNSRDLLFGWREIIKRYDPIEIKYYNKYGQFQKMEGTDE
ncbi:hypothetical protein [uncultured Cetobacterium sp.]|uniref:hypothetical protein n=1 Tax=uncultured Cetobacterium sp. TaxID=527638 RepID=UPI00262CCC6A|nr:hypothetical protein [uncultured Cetobacterium sp.]